MNAPSTLAAWSVAVMLATVAPQALSGDGHDHGDAPAPAAGPALPHFTAVSELFELVGVVDGKQVTLYLDHFADNSPVKDARLEVQLDGNAIAVEPHAEGEFEAVLEQELKPGVVSVTATVSAGQESDLLAGELELHESTEAEEQDHEQGWKPLAGWLGASVLALGLVGWGFLRKGASRNKSTGGAA